MSTDNNDPENAERVFLHDIATPIAVALGMIDLVVDEAAAGESSLTQSQQKRLDKAQVALVKLQGMLADRRASLLRTEPEF